MVDNFETQERLHLDFLALLLHDLESPLAVAKHFLRRVEDGRHDPQNPKHLELVKSTRLAVDRAERILEDVLDLARTSGSGNLKTCPAFSDLRKLIRDCVAMVSPLAEDKDIDIHDDVDSLLPDLLLFDSALITRVIDNFLVNAIRHAPRKSDIVITVRSYGTHFCLNVINQSEEKTDLDMNRIFDPVYQVQTRQKRQHLGTGLGLSFCRLAVEAQNGRIGAEQDREGKISFWFELPIKTSD